MFKMECRREEADDTSRFAGQCEKLKTKHHSYNFSMTAVSDRLNMIDVNISFADSLV